MLLPLLEYSYSDVLLELNYANANSQIVISELIEYTLKCPSEYWLSLAISWFENGLNINFFNSNKLLEISNNKFHSQYLRHRSLALFNK